MKKVLLALTIVLVSCSLALAQEQTVSGTVTNADGTGIPGITVQVKGTNTGTATNANGHYELSVPQNASTFIFSGVGYTRQEIAVNGRSTVNATMQSSTSQLNELVVTALGIQRQEREIGYSTKEVDDKTLTESKPVSVAEGLTGKVAGLQINTINNGVDPGTRIVLRGYRHLNADNQALVVVDGVPVRTNFLSSLNPNDIKSITVLKGASAAALYGVDATNGVIVVTTNRGSATGKPTIKFNNTTMLERISYMPELQEQFSPGSGEVGPYPWAPPSYAPDQDKIYYFKDPYTGFNQYVPYENQNYGMEFNNDPNLAYLGGPGPDGSFFKQPFEAIHPDPRRAFFQTGYRIQNNLSYSGGDDENSYFLSVQDVSTKGTIPKDEARRTSFYVSGKKTFGRFSAQFSMNYSQRYSNTVGGDFTQDRPVYWNLMNQGANVPLNDPRIKDPDSPYFLDRYYNGYYPNPWWQIYNSRVIDKTNYFNGNLTLNLQATDWLNLTYRAGTNFTTFNNHTTKSWAGYSEWRRSDTWETGGTYPAHQNGQATYREATARSIQQDIMATFTKEIGDFKGTLILGNSISEKPYQNDYSSYMNVSSEQLFVDDFYNVSYRLGELSGNQGIEKQRLISGYGDLTLGYKNYLFLHGNLRRDWTSLLPKGKNAYNFWAVDASWVFTDAIPAFKSQNFLTYGKLRVAYSHTGDITVSPYNIENVFDVVTGYPYGGQAGLSLNSRFRNPNLKPEQTVEREIGFDLGFWNSRISLNADYYHANTTGQTFPVNISTATGYSSAFVNAGDVMSEGVELGLNATIIQNSPSGFNWEVGANYSWNGSKVLSMYGSGESKVTDFNIGGYTGNTGSDHAVIGHPFPVLETTDVDRDPQGRVIVSKTTGEPTLVDTMKIFGRVNPSDIFNINTTLKWKQFTFYAQASYRGGNVFYAFVGSSGQLSFTGSPKYTTQNGRQRFIFPNSVYEEGGKYIPNDKYYIQSDGPTWWTQSDYAAAGAPLVENAAFWKLRNISLSYDFSKLVGNLNWLQGLTFTVMAKNLLMLRPSQNVWTDPEFNYTNGNAQGITNYDQLPPSRQFGASLDVTF